MLGHQAVLQATVHELLRRLHGLVTEEAEANPATLLEGVSRLSGGRLSVLCCAAAQLLSPLLEGTLAQLASGERRAGLRVLEAKFLSWPDFLVDVLVGALNE